MKRNGFLRAVALTSVGASAAALSVFQISSLAQDSSAQARLPLLHGNGVADDTEAVQAMIDGRKYVDAQDGAVHQQGSVVHFRPGTYNIRGAIRLRDHQAVDGHGCTLVQAVPGEPSLVISRGDVVRGFCLISKPVVTLGAS